MSQLTEAFEQIRNYVNDRMHSAPTPEAKREASLMRDFLTELYQERVSGSVQSETQMPENEPTEEELREFNAKHQVDKKNAESFEIQLERLIERMLPPLGLRPEESEVSDELFKAMKQTGKLSSITALTEEYDRFYDVATELGIDDLIEKKFAWFYGLNKKKNHNE